MGRNKSVNTSLPKNIFIKNNRYWFSYTDEFGKRTQKSSYGDDLEVAVSLQRTLEEESKLKRRPEIANIVKKLQRGKLKPVSISDLLTDYFKSEIRQNADFKERECILEAFKSWHGINSFVCDIDVNTLIDFRNHMFELRRAKLKRELAHLEYNNTSNHHRTYLLSMLGYAVTRGYYDELQHASLFKQKNYKKLTITKKPRQSLNEKQIHGLFIILRRPQFELLFQIVLFALASGLRQSRIFGLQWAFVEENRLLAPPKGRGSEWESIPLNSVLSKYLAERSAVKNGPYVFHHKNGKRITSLKESWRDALHLAGIKQRNDKNSKKRVAEGKLDPFKCEIDIMSSSACFHSLRHTYTTMLISQHVDIREIQLRLGHKNLETTVRYIDSLTSPTTNATADASIAGKLSKLGKKAEEELPIDYEEWTPTANDYDEDGNIMPPI